MPRTGNKARLAVAAVLAATASPEPSPQKAKKGKQRSVPTPVEVDDSRDDSPAGPSSYLLRCTNHNTGVCRSSSEVKVSMSKMVVLRSSRDREAIA